MDDDEPGPLTTTMAARLMTATTMIRIRDHG